MAWRGIDGPPASYLATGDWPDGRIEGPPPAHVARQLVINLRDAMGERGLREVARAADINHSSLRSVLRGEAWPDLITIARLEDALQVGLWPGRPSRESG